MSKRNKTAIQKNKQKLAYNQRKRYSNIKQDPELYELVKEKEKKRYKRRKDNGQFMSINEKSPRDQRVQRQKWREAAKKYRDKKKNEGKKEVVIEPVFINTDSTNETEIINSQNQLDNTINDTLKELNCNCSAKIKKIRYLESKKRKELLKVIQDLKREKSRLKWRLLSQKSIENKENMIRQFRESTQTFKEKKTSVVVEKTIEKMIKDFYTDDANSTICSGKKQFITRFKVQKQKRYLRSSIKELHLKFLKLHKFKISYTTFWRNRPFWVLPPTAAQRDTCMCTVHANMDLKLESLSRAGIIQEKNSEELLNSLCCSRYEEKCLKRECHSCKDAVLHYNEFLNNEEIICSKWIRSRESVTVKTGPKTITITRKEEIKMKPLEAINELLSDLPAFFEHCFLMQTQYKNMKDLKTSLTVNSAVILVDFSENYALKATNEVQSLHFGGSRKELCLHTAVVYAFDFQVSDIKPTSVCTVSECLKHDATAVWAHLIPLLNKAIEMNPFLNILHFQSDSPTSQYRNKFMFYIIAQLANEFPQITEITWNYTESGHGKGAADGVGAVIKRTADLEVNHGTDITSIQKFITVVQARTNIAIIAVNETDIQDRVKMIPAKLQAFKGTLKVHQILWERNCNTLTLRTSSCFTCACGQVCIHGKHLGFMAITNPGHKTKNRGKNKENVTMLKDTKTVTRRRKVMRTSQDQDIIDDKPSNIKILSNKLIIVKKQSKK